MVHELLTSVKTECVCVHNEKKNLHIEKIWNFVNGSFQVNHVNIIRWADKILFLYAYSDM